MPGVLDGLSDLLGEIHDKQELVDDLGAAAETAIPDTREQFRLVTQVVEAEKRALHAKYLVHRERLLTVCREEAHPSSPRVVVVRPLAAAGALAFSALLLSHRHAR